LRFCTIAAQICRSDFPLQTRRNELSRDALVSMMKAADRWDGQEPTRGGP
jgi:hypothetical protein